MKLKNIIFYLVLVVLIAAQLRAQNTNPEVTNVAFIISGTTVTVTYDLTDAVQTTVTISMQVSSDNGVTWNFNYGVATGAIGAGVVTGTGKIISWTYSGGYNTNFKIRIFANDETAGGSTCPGVATVDYGGKTYNTIQIGTQCWLKENLDVGIKINGSQNPSNDGNIEKYCYNDLDANCITYGGLYQWHEAMKYVTTEGAHGICPTGWHIPMYAELQTLKSTVSADGNALKEIEQGNGAGAGTNTSGYSALLAGYRNNGGGFYSLNSKAYFWSSTESAPSYAYYVTLVVSNSSVSFLGTYEDYGLSVRCLKD